MNSPEKPAIAGSEELKQCCSRLYESDIATLLLGDSFHPGGLTLTERVGRLLQLTSRSRVLDMASGKGASAMFIAERFGCEVIGIEYGRKNVEQANDESTRRGLGRRARFQQADAESLSFPDASFDAVICECAFCTFPDKARVASEFARVLCHGGQLGMSDLTRGPSLPKELDGLLAWVSCIGDARPIEDYYTFLVSAGLSLETTEMHNDALVETVGQIRTKLLGVEIMTGLKKLNLPDLDLAVARQMAKSALNAIQQGQLGYAIITARKSKEYVQR